MDIKERLRLLESLPRARQRIHNSPLPASQGDNNASQALDGQTISNEFGSYSVVEKRLSCDLPHGNTQLGTLLHFSPELLALLDNNSELSKVDFRQTLFIDTETTGLSGGAGTCAFLVGIGYFDADEFVVSQYLMNDFNEENAMLHDLREVIDRFELIVTYNGKSYDIPLLQSRNIFQGIKISLEGKKHFDLLHTVRRLWSHRLPDCSLSTAETTLLAAYRHGDVPGYMIPYIYFEYVKTRDARPLVPILSHNHYDIVTMVCLLTLALNMLANPKQMCRSTRDILQTAKIFEKAGQFHDAIALYREGISKVMREEDKYQLLNQLAFAYKKLSDWTAAAEAWEAALQISGHFHPLPYIELAKHYEHRHKDLSKAAHLVRSALREVDLVSSLRPRSDWQPYREDLEHRLRRLTTKRACSDHKK